MFKYVIDFFLPVSKVLRVPEEPVNGKKRGHNLSSEPQIWLNK